jgi:hypothetical protein
MIATSAAISSTKSVIGSPLLWKKVEVNAIPPAD